MKVLYADTYKPPKELVNDITRNGFCDFIITKTLKKSMEVLKSTDIDLIFVGKDLDSESGIDFIRRLGETEYKSLPVVYVSEDDELSRDLRFSLGIVDSVSRNTLDVTRVMAYLDRILEQVKLIEGIKLLSIAIIDDSRVSVEIISAVLREAGINRFKSYTDPRDLISSGETFDIYFIDMVMPGIEGDKLVSMMRSLSPKSIIISMSSIDNTKTISNVLSSGADDYIIKPFNKDVLLARLKTNFRSYKLLMELEDKNRELDLLSKTDSLTGAFNHGYIYKKLQSEVEEATFKGSTFSMLLLDLDFFKEVNDSFGHVCGDKVLVAVTKIFNDNSTGSDFFGRYGGEEFIFIMPDKGLEEAKGTVLKLHDFFKKKKIEGVTRPVTFSGGLVEWKGDSVSDYIKRADKLLYQAKNEGRNKIIW